MFAKTIIDSDAFLDMPVTARLLYYDLAMRADDDGFINSPKKIMRMVGASEDDMSILIIRKFIIPFANGVVVIKHWRIHNYIQSDRYKPTPYQDEKALLEVEDNKSYRLKTSMDTKCIQDVSSLETQVRIGKSKDRIGKDNNSADGTKFTPPTLEEVKAYCDERKNNVDPERFIDYYASQKWKKANGRPVADWKACVRQWEKETKKEPKKEEPDIDEIGRRMGWWT